MIIAFVCDQFNSFLCHRLFLPSIGRNCVGVETVADQQFDLVTSIPGHVTIVSVIIIVKKTRVTMLFSSSALSPEEFEIQL